MITEDYVSFETAKLLKEKGFNTAVRNYYQKIDDDITYHIEDFRNWNVYDMWYSMPTLQMVMKWLREVHNLHIMTLPYAPMDRHPYHHGEADVVYMVQLFKGIIPIDAIGRSIIKLTNEEACEAAIKYSLENLIK